MLTRLTLLAVAAALAVAPAAAAEKGTPEVKSISALAFGPEGLLFIGDAQSATIFAVETGDTAPAGKGDVNVAKLNDAIGSALGTTGDNIAVADVKVNPASGNVYLAVNRGKGKEATPVLVRLHRDGKLAEFPLKDVTFTKVTIPNATEKQRAEVITSMAFADGKLIVAGLSNEEFASTLRTFPYPFKDADKGAGIQIYHGAHGRLETNSPIRTFAIHKIGPAQTVIASYQCTPLVKIPLEALKPGEKVTGTTIAELGNRNRPLDMITYTKDGKDFILMANNARGVMKIPTDTFADAQPITSRPQGEKSGVPYETVKELTGVIQLDKLDGDRAVVLMTGEDKSLTLKSVPLP